MSYEDVLIRESVGDGTVDPDDVCMVCDKRDCVCVEEEGPITTILRFGHFGCVKQQWTVFAKDYRGERVPVVYANRTQAQRKANELGSAWAVKQGAQSRRFFVALVATTTGRKEAP